MKTNSKLSIFALHQRLSRPGATIVLGFFTFGYLSYLVFLLFLNMQKGWFITNEPPVKQEVQYGSQFNEIYTFEYYFRSYDYSFYSQNGVSPQLTNSTTPFLLRSEIVFFISLIAIVIALTLAHVKTNRNSSTIKRLPILDRNVNIMLWLSDCIYVLLMWLAHIAVIFLFSIIYTSLAPFELTYPQNLYQLFASERYLYLLFPIINPISIIRMFSMVLSISFLPTLISYIFHLEDSIWSKIRFVIILVGLIGWGYFADSHIWSIIICIIAAAVCFLFARHHFLSKGDSADAAKTT